MKDQVTIQIFATGKQTDAAGNTKTWTEADLDKIIAATKKVKEAVPVTVGHPVDNAPAFAWVEPKEIFRKGKKLFAKMGNITKEFGEALERKNFKNRSIALRNDFSMRHLAFLGGVMAAVKGMDSFAFKEGEELQIFEEKFDGSEFADHDVLFGFKTIARVLQRMRDRFIEKDGVEKADDVIHQFEIDTLNRMKENTGHENELFSEKDLNPGDDPDNNEDTNMDFKEQFEAEQKKAEKLTADLEAANKEKDTFSETATTEKKRADDLQTEKDTLAKDTKAKAFNEYAEKLVEDKKILPAEKASVIAMLNTVDGQEAIDFAEGDKTVKKTPLDIYKKQLDNKSVGGLFGESFADKATPAQSRNKELAEKITEIEKAEKCTYGEASKILRERDPGIFENLVFTEEAKEK